MERDIRSKRPQTWVPPWSDEDGSKHSMFYNLVRFYAVDLTQLNGVDRFVLIDDDVVVTTVGIPNLERLENETLREAITADCMAWTFGSVEPRLIRWFESDVVARWKPWLDFLVRWPGDTRSILNSTWWNFGLTIVDRFLWKSSRLTERFESARDLYLQTGLPLESVDYGLVLAQVAFSGHVGCLLRTLFTRDLDTWVSHVIWRDGQTVRHFFITMGTQSLGCPDEHSQKRCTKRLLLQVLCRFQVSLLLAPPGLPTNQDECDRVRTGVDVRSMRPPRWCNVYHGRPDKCRNAYIKRGPGVFEHCVYKESMRICRKADFLFACTAPPPPPAFMPERVLEPMWWN